VVTRIPGAENGAPFQSLIDEDHVELTKKAGDPWSGEAGCCRRGREADAFGKQVTLPRRDAESKGCRCGDFRVHSPVPAVC